MPMSRKHYTEVAQILANRFIGHGGDRNPAARAMIEGIADDMADMFTRDNPRFDRGRFMEAVGKNFDLPEDLDMIDSDGPTWSNYGGWVN